jgi:hypothetical protein
MSTFTTTKENLLNLSKTLSIMDKQDLIIAIKADIKADLLAERAKKALIIKQRKTEKEIKLANDIIKMQAKLQALLDKQNPAGYAAIKSNKAPSACTVTTLV